jgi:hypothetical protein
MPRFIPKPRLRQQSIFQQPCISNNASKTPITMAAGYWVQHPPFTPQKRLREGRGTRHPAIYQYVLVMLLFGPFS